MDNILTYKFRHSDPDRNHEVTVHESIKMDKYIAMMTRQGFELVETEKSLIVIEHKEETTIGGAKC